MFYKYRTDQNNTIVAKSVIAFVGLAGNEAQVSSSVEIFDFQPLHLYRVVGGLVVENTDDFANEYLRVVENIDPPSQITTYKYNAGAVPTVRTNKKVFNGQAQTNSSGVATFEVTLDGLSTGTAIFSTMDSITATAQNNTSLITDVPFASIKAITNGKTVTVNVVNSSSILVGGQGLEFVNAGIIVHLRIEGI